MQAVTNNAQEFNNATSVIMTTIEANNASDGAIEAPIEVNNTSDSASDSAIDSPIEAPMASDSTIDSPIEAPMASDSPIDSPIEAPMASDSPIDSPIEAPMASDSPIEANNASDGTIEASMASDKGELMGVLETLSGIVSEDCKIIIDEFISSELLTRKYFTLTTNEELKIIDCEIEKLEKISTFVKNSKFAIEAIVSLKRIKSELYSSEINHEFFKSMGISFDELLYVMDEIDRLENVRGFANVDLYLKKQELEHQFISEIRQNDFSSFQRSSQQIAFDDEIINYLKKNNMTFSLFRDDSIPEDIDSTLGKKLDATLGEKMDEPLNSTLGEIPFVGVTSNKKKQKNKTPAAKAPEVKVPAVKAAIKAPEATTTLAVRATETTTDVKMPAVNNLCSFKSKSNWHTNDSTSEDENGDSGSYLDDESVGPNSNKCYICVVFNSTFNINPGAELSRLFIYTSHGIEHICQDCAGLVINKLYERKFTSSKITRNENGHFNCGAIFKLYAPLIRDPMMQVHIREISESLRKNIKKNESMCRGCGGLPFIGVKDRQKIFGDYCDSCVSSILSDQEYEITEDDSTKYANTIYNSSINYGKEYIKILLKLWARQKA